jgi:chromatin remodeling complex protein RSC6
MKSLTDYVNESLLENEAKKAQADTQDTEKEASNAEESIKDEKSFREFAKAKFEAVFGDELDEDKMNKTIDGILNDNKELVDKGDWGELVGILNKSFGK